MLLTVYKNKYKIVTVIFIILTSNSTTNAQLCTGSLGDPVVNITFGSGTATHGSALGSSVTSYTYSSASFPNDGYYTIENTTAGAGSVWWSTTDHTGNSGGYMMVVNASYSVTDYFYKKTITGLCPNTTYEFATWVMNLLRSSDKSPPNITFLIETTNGTILNSYTTGSISLQDKAVWRQFGFYFTTLSNATSVVIRMRNNSAGGAPANDIAIDDITFRPCGPAITAAFAETNTTSYTVCAGTDANLQLQGTISSGYSNPMYQWQIYSNNEWTDISGATSINSNISMNNLSAGTYNYRLTVGESSNFSSTKCRVVSNSVTLNIDFVPLASYELASEIVCVTQPTQFFDKSQASSVLTYLWSFGDGETSTEQNPSHVYANTGTYLSTLIVTTNHGCKDTATLPAAIKVYTIPQAGFTVGPIDTTIFYPYVWVTDKSLRGAGCIIDWGDEDTTDCNTIEHIYNKAGTYTITQIVVNADGCYDKLYIEIIKRPEYRFFMPNAFTPDGNDGFNEIFKPSIMGVHDYSFLIYDRWGEKIFETHNTDEGWDGNYKGEPCKEGVFAYKINFIDDLNNFSYEFAGIVSIIK